MATRAEILKKIKSEARKRGVTWQILREGANHTIYILDGVLVPVSRGSKDFGQAYTEAIYRECEPVFGIGWWR